MMNNKMTLAYWIDQFDEGRFDSTECSVQIQAGWHDWFCSDKSLRNKLHAMAPKVKQIAASHKVNPESTYVLFRNNCPMKGPFYDDFRICDINTGEVIFTVAPKSGHTGKAEVWCRENDFQGPIVSGSWRDVKKFFGV